jgi:(+)-trans-carveol dehydrogenase
MLRTGDIGVSDRSFVCLARPNQWCYAIGVGIPSWSPACCLPGCGIGRTERDCHGRTIRLAEEGAEIIACDVCRQLDSVPYPMATAEDLKETVALVEKLDRRILAREADVRDLPALADLAADGVAEFGRLDIVCANAAIVTLTENAWSLDEQTWDEVIAVNLSGVWRTVKSAVPAMIEAGNGGSIVITSSTAGLKGMAHIAHYAAAKHGVVGLARTLANELAPHMIRVNTVHPTAVNTPMVANEYVANFLENATDLAANMLNALPVSMLEPLDISNAIVWLCSEEARYVTSVALPVDAGLLQK